MAELDYDALQRLADAATPGPWTWSGDLSAEEATLEPRVIWASGMHTEGYIYISPADAEFIAAARTTIPALLDRVRELEYYIGSYEIATKLDEATARTELIRKSGIARERDAALSAIANVEAFAEGLMHDGVEPYTRIGKAIGNAIKAALGSVPSTGEGNE